MIYTERVITVRKGESTIDEPIVVYRGDYELEIRFTITNSKLKYSNAQNLIEVEKASYGQLAVLTPYGGNIFSDISECSDGTVTFVLSKEMLNQIEEVGLYSFQIRLFDINKESRVSIPPIEFGIEVREPIASEDHDNSVNNAIVGYSIAKVVDGLNEDVPDTFDANERYNKTNWRTGDRISQGKLNKIEDAIYKINQNEKNDKEALNKQMTSNFNVLQSQTENKLEIVRKRMDSFTRLQEGSTTGDSELIDARIGVDAFVYDNLGGAIRTQINDINKDKISKTDLYITNLLNPNTLMKNTCCEFGAIKPYDGWNTTDYIEIDNNKKYSLFIFTDNDKNHFTNTYVDQFDRNQVYIPESTLTKTLTNSKLCDYTFDDKTKYIRVSGPSEYIGTDGMIILTQHEKLINSYLPYGESLTVISEVISDVKDNTKEIENIKANTYQNVIRSINRIGYDVYNGSTPPQQSIKSFKMAYDKGFRVLLCDLRFTSDNVPVLHHDDNINTYALNADGSEIQDTVLIAETTYEKLLEYDYGLYKGQQYKGTKIMHLKDMLKLCKKLGCELYIEVKYMNEAQCKIAFDLVRMYAMENKTSWCGDTHKPDMRYVINNIDTARVSTMPQEITDSCIDTLNSLKTGKNEVFFFAWDTTELSEELVKKLIDKNIKFEFGTIDTEAAILNYFKQDDIYYYCTGIESNKLIAGKVILENETEI